MAIKNSSSESDRSDLLKKLIAVESVIVKPGQPRKDIYEIKVVKFSILKTFGNVAKGGAWVAAAAGIFVVIAVIGV